MKKTCLFILLFSINFYCSFATIYYVAPNGNNANAGKIDQPFATVQKAQEIIHAGDTVYIRGGLHNMTENQIAHKKSIFADVTYLDKSGSKNKLINYWAYPN